MKSSVLLNGLAVALSLFLFELAGRVSAQADDSSQNIEPGDTVQITVYQDSRLDTLQRVSTDGTISMLYIGQVSVRDDSTQEAANKIANLLFKDKYIRNAEVQVAIDSYVKEYVTVKGQVTHPGPVILQKEHPMDLLEAIASAGGETATGDLGNVAVRRDADGKVATFKVNLKEMGKQNKVFLVQPGDVITVGLSVF